MSDSVSPILLPIPVAIREDSTQLFEQGFTRKHLLCQRLTAANQPVLNTAAESHGIGDVAQNVNGAAGTFGKGETFVPGSRCTLAE